MSKVKAFKDQYDDENMLLLFRKHPVVIRKYLIAFSFMLLVGVLPSLIWPEPRNFFIGLVVGALVGGLIMFYGWIGWFYSVFIVTDKRFMQVVQSGLFNRSVVDIALDQIQMVNYEVKGMQETMLGFGTLSVQTMVGELNINNVHKPEHIQRELSGIIRKHIKGAPIGEETQDR